MGGACGSHGRGEKRVMVLVGNPKERGLLEEQDVDGIGSEWMLGTWAGGMEWIQLAQDRGRWRALVNTVMFMWVLVPRS
jgi:hypothetical protein